MHYLVMGKSWKVEYIADQANILIDDHALKDFDKEVVGMGFPTKLAERLVKLHNDSLNEISKKIEDLEEMYSYPAG